MLKREKQINTERTNRKNAKEWDIHINHKIPKRKKLNKQKENKIITYTNAAPKRQAPRRALPHLDCIRGVCPSTQLTPAPSLFSGVVHTSRGPLLFPPMSEQAEAGTAGPARVLISSSWQWLAKSAVGRWCICGLMLSASSAVCNLRRFPVQDDP